MFASELDLMAQAAERSLATARAERRLRDPELAWAEGELPPWRSHWSFRDWLGRLNPARGRRADEPAAPARPAIVGGDSPTRPFGSEEDRAA
jgi:hypothetical protein